MKNTATIRTRLTHDTLKESINILQTVIDVCKNCDTDDVSWNQACRIKNLDPIKTRQVILRLYKLCIL